MTMLPFLRDIAQLFFPPTCCGCGSLLVGDEKYLCGDCLLHLPETIQAALPDNTTEQRLVGYYPFEAAYSHLFFTKKSITQHILHQIKYKGNTQLAIFMGRQMGMALRDSHRFDRIDIIVPVPLHRRRKRRRGYNQSELLTQGIAQVFPHPIMEGNLVRSTHTHTQTNKNRQERLDNMKGVFRILNPKEFEGKHILLVDDVLTTGATTGACADALLRVPGVTISIATLAIASD